MTTDRTQHFLATFRAQRPVFYGAAARGYQEEPDLFRELAEPMLEWAEALLGEGYERVLLDGYAEFVVDVNRSQLRYEREGRYPFSQYEQVYAATYGNSAFMNPYHWGVYATTFLWRHHLEIYRFFRDAFLASLVRRREGGRLLDLGCGSGIWHLMLLRRLPTWHATAVDISETSIGIARRMAQSIDARVAVNHVVHDALDYRVDAPVDAAISCFLMEHLERPQDLLERLAACLAPAGYAFVTCALTAAETDHIYEMRRESEPVAMAEAAGFRVLATLSAAPADIPSGRRYLPRSMAMLLQKRRGDIW